MEELMQLKWFLENSFRTPAQGKRWLHQPVPALQGRTPISVLIDGDIDERLSRSTSLTASCAALFALLLFILRYIMYRQESYNGAYWPGRRQ
jgi:hypothetical protein